MNLKPLIIAVATTALPVCVCAANTDSDIQTFASDSLSLDDCLAIALNNNPTVKVADMEVKRMDYSKKEVIGQFLPNIDFGATYSRTVAKQVMYMNMDGFGDFGGSGGSTGGEEGEPAPQAASRAGNGIKVGLDNSYSLGFQASMPLIAPQLWASLSVSDTQIQRNVEAANKSRQQLVNQIKSAYYGLLLAKDSKRVIRESYDMAALTHETYTKQHKLGAASDYDVLRTSVAMKNIEPQLTQADIALKRARLNLVILMGIDANFDLKVRGELADYEAGMYGETMAAIDNRDITGNADLRLLDIDTKLLEKSLKISKLAYSPTLALSANYNWTSMSNGSPFSNFRWTPYSAVGLSLAVPIFSGGQRWNKVKQAQIQVEEMQWQRENLERSVAMQVDLAIDNIKMNVQQIASSAESVKQAETAHSIMEQSFNIGAASYLNLRDSELALTQARLAYYQSIYNYLIARSELELLQGTAPIHQFTTSK